VTRARYLFHLAHLCGCPPPVTDTLGVGDFARLITGIDAQLEALAKTGR